MKKICSVKFEEHTYNVINIQELIKEHIEDVIIVSVASETISNEIYEQLIQSGFKSENVICSLIKDYQYFDKDIIKYGKNEVFVDCGCYNCLSDFVFLENCSDYKKIIAFEPQEDNFELCGKIKTDKNINMDIYPVGAWNCKTDLSFSEDGPRSSINNNGIFKISVDTIDNYCINEEVTFIKMDIEGAELNALKGAEKTIKKYTPKLAICVYHKPEDIIDIPLYIHSIVPEYKFYLRHYSCLHNGHETVLYAVKSTD